jgi:PIN domain nuclease of toxin-antitoxin system
LNAPLLLDTCALIWASNGAEAPLLRDQLRKAYSVGREVWISPITAWEIGNLAAARRIVMARPALSWFEDAISRSGARLADLGPKVLVASTELPGEMHRDPADRIIVATAREYGLRVITRDQKILDYAAKGHVMAQEC